MNTYALPTIIAPSLLAANFAQLQRDVQRVEQAGADWLHLDVMDGHFVPNISFGIPVITSIQNSTNLILDVHLMLAKPCQHLASFLALDIDIITIHIEAESDIVACLKQIKQAGKRCGLALNPDTDFQRVVPYLADIDLLLCMTVFPGFGGQKFISEVTTKIAQAAVYRQQEQLDYVIEVDGGISLTTAPDCLQAGASVLVAGTAIFGADNQQQAIQQLRQCGNC